MCFCLLSRRRLYEKKNKILCMIMLSLCFGASFAFAENVDVKITDRYDKLVEEYVLQQANCIDNGVKFTESENAAEEINNYLKNQEAVREVYLKKDDYKATAEILEKEILNDVIYFKVNVKATWVYEGSVDDSSYAKLVDVLVDKDTGKIIDYYDINSFTLAVRGEVDIKNEKNRLTKELVAASLDKYETKMTATKEMINESVKKDRLKLNVCERTAARAAYLSANWWFRLNRYRSFFFL